MDTSSFLEISGVVIAIVIAIVTFMKTKESEQSLKFLSTATMAFLIIILTLMMSFRYDIMPRLESYQKEALRHAEAFELAGKYASAIKISVETDDNFFYETINSRYDEFGRELDMAINGQYKIRKDELCSYSCDLISTAKSTIVATSYVKSEEFWDNPCGRTYENINFSLVQKGVHIKRFFIYSDTTELNRDEEMIKRQMDNGINVFIAFAPQLSVKDMDDVIIVDDKIGGRLKLTPDKGIIHAVMYTARKDLESIMKTIDNIGLKAIKGENAFKP